MRGRTSLVAIEQISADEVWTAPGENVLLLNERASDANVFFVLEGELTFRLGDAEHRVEPETWVRVPPEADYSIAVSKSGTARFLHLRVPSAEPSSGVVICRAGGAEGDKITDRPERQATVLVESDDITISEFDYGPGEHGAQPHVHRRHADGFLLLEGELTFHFHDGSRALPAGTLLVISPGVVHGFDNDSDERMRCFNFHMPSLGFADYMRGQNPDFDQFDPPEDGGLDPSSVVVTRISA